VSGQLQLVSVLRDGILIVEDTEFIVKRQAGRAK